MSALGGLARAGQQVLGMYMQQYMREDAEKRKLELLEKMEERRMKRTPVGTKVLGNKEYAVNALGEIINEGRALTPQEIEARDRQIALDKAKLTEAEAKSTVAAKDASYYDEDRQATLDDRQADNRRADEQLNISRGHLRLAGARDRRESEAYSEARNPINLLNKIAQEGGDLQADLSVGGRRLTYAEWADQVINSDKPDSEKREILQMIAARARTAAEKHYRDYRDRELQTRTPRTTRGQVPSLTGATPIQPPFGG